MSQDAGIDLPAYFARIGHGGETAASLDTLKALHRLHPAAIAFENLSPLMDEPPSLDPAALQAKLVAGGRGGWCYEHNGLFRGVLQALGFEVRGLAARVSWGAPEAAPPRPRSHMALLVDLPQGPFLADVGFGGLTLTAPLALEPGLVQETPHERFRLERTAEGDYELQAEIGGGWRALYRFDLSSHQPMDYEPLNWFSATHPSSPFPRMLMAARAEPRRRLALANGRLTVRPLDGEPEERTLGSLAELAHVLRTEFGLVLPAGFERIGPKLGLS